MIELLLLLLGLFLGLSIATWRFRRAAAAMEETAELEVEPTPEPEPEPPPPVVEDCTEQLERDFARRVVAESQEPLYSLANGIGRELADLATAVQGNAQLLCEVMGEPEQVATRCEHLWAGVNRLRLLTEKILTFARDQRLKREPIDVRVFLDEVRRETETVHGNLISVQVATSPFLPPALAHPRALHNAILFVIETLLEIEPCTYTLSIAAYAAVGDDDATSIGIEICAEAEESGARPARRPKEALKLGYLAARRSLEAQGARLSIHQVEGLSATSFITLDADAPQEAAPTPEQPDVPEHEFGGVLVLERDSSIRSMIATEVERRGRKILTCVDAASARALLEATPERFELLILEVHAPHGGGMPIAIEARERHPNVKVLVLGSAREDEPDLADNSLEILHKPFGILELRDSLETLLEPTNAGDPELRVD